MKKIIIVDDDPAIQNAFSLIFDPLLYMVTVYSTAAPILNGEYDLPDIYILDKQLSGVNGLDLCIYLKSGAATKHIPVVMISASPDITRLAEYAGAAAALEKPFRMKRLREIVLEYLQ
ncbi:MAG: response regulator [Chitinophagaceae bacterium]|nr:response regulator [Chitinophagaceae bacterium]